MQIKSHDYKHIHVNNMCVKMSNIYLCFKLPGPLSIEERCNMFGGIIANPTECQAYYNCSVRYQDVPVPGLLECSYPQLFNADTKQCEHFENVKCGTRKEFKDACMYT